MRTLRIAALLVALCGPVQAQTRGPGPILLLLPPSTRGLAMGETYPAMAADPEAIFVNPALLQNARGMAGSLQRYGSASTFSSLSATTDVGLGFGVQILEYAPVIITAAQEIGSAYGLSQRGPAAASEVVASIGYMRTFFGKVRLGVTGKWAQHWGAGFSDGVPAVDIGTAVNPFNWLNITAGVHNLGADLELGQLEYDLPTRYTVYASTRSRPVGPLDLAFAARAGLNEAEDPTGALGMEAGYWPFSGLNFYARAGARFGPVETAGDIEPSRITAGGGLTFRRVSLDYAWEPFDAGDDAHRIGLRFR
jgi:hypothetical protein